MPELGRSVTMIAVRLSSGWCNTLRTVTCVYSEAVTSASGIRMPCCRMHRHAMSLLENVWWRSVMISDTTWRRTVCQMIEIGNTCMISCSFNLAHQDHLPCPTVSSCCHLIMLNADRMHNAVQVFAQVQPLCLEFGASVTLTLPQT